jgi:hypothetical protein
LPKAVVAADLLFPGENPRGSTPLIRPGLAEQSDGAIDLAQGYRATIDLAVLLRVAQQRKDEIKNLSPVRCFSLCRLHGGTWRRRTPNGIAGEGRPNYLPNPVACFRALWDP